MGMVLVFLCGRGQPSSPYRNGRVRPRARPRNEIPVVLGGARGLALNSRIHPERPHQPSRPRARPRMPAARAGRLDGDGFGVPVRLRPTVQPLQKRPCSPTPTAAKASAPDGWIAADTASRAGGQPFTLRTGRLAHAHGCECLRRGLDGWMGMVLVFLCGRGQPSSPYRNGRFVGPKISRCARNDNCERPSLCHLERW